MDKNFNFIASNKAAKYLQEINTADILVGMPSYNNIVTANYVVSQIVKGLDKYFPNYKSTIFVSDGSSSDGTLNSVSQVNNQKILN